jgi:Tfp pilus assembly PilM family ATPase
MASRVFAVDLGAWSVKLAIASPGLRGAALTSVYERLVPPGDESADVRARRVLATLIDELRLRDETGYLGVYGDQVFTQVLDFGFKSLRRADLDKAVGGELEGVVPVDLEDMVYAFETLPPAPPVAPPVEGVPVEPVRGRVAPPSEGMRVLTYAMRRDRAEALLAVGHEAHFDPRGLLACGGAAVRLVERTPSLAKARADGAVAVIDIGHERTDIIVVSGGKAVFSRSLARGGRAVTEAVSRNWKLSFADAERAKHSDGFVASQTEPATSDAWARIHGVTITELAPFARDIRQTLVACRARTGFQPLAAIAVGGGARLRGMGSFLAEQLAIPTWRLTADDITALAGPRIGVEAAAGMPIDSAALTVGMAYDCAGGRPQFDLRSGALAVRVDLSFLRSKAVPLIASVVTIAAFASASAYADLRSLQKSEKILDTRLAAESAEHFGSARSVEEILGESEPGGSGAVSTTGSPLPRMSAYDILLEISSRLVAHDKMKVDIDKLTIDTQNVSIEGFAKSTEDDPGLVKASDEVESIYNELKKIDCFKEPQRGNVDTDAGGKRFRFTIAHTCMQEGR